MKTIIEYIFNWLDQKLPIVIVPLCIMMLIRIFYQIIKH